MYVEQALKYEKALITYFFSSRKKVLKKHIYTFCFYVLNQFYSKRPLLNLRIQSEQSLLNENELDCLSGNNETADILRFEISSEKMNELLTQRQICAADIRCLDVNSKQCLKKLCLKNCLYSTTLDKPTPQLLDEFNIADSNIKTISLACYSVKPPSIIIRGDL